MMWDIVVPAWLALLTADTDFVVAIGTSDGEPNMYPAAASRPITIPSVEYLIFDDRETELFNPLRVQVDYWARGMAAAALIERRLRTVTHRDVSRVVTLPDTETLRLWTRYLDSRTHEYPERGVVHRSIDFLLEPVRARFHP